MRRLLPKHLLLILALVLGQWLAVAHAHEHAPLALDQACKICLHAPGVDSAALGGKSPLLLLPAHSTEPLPAPYPAIGHDAVSQPSIRGPPAIVC